LTARLTFSDVDCFKPVNDAWACASVVSRRKKGVLDLTLLLEATREIASMRIIRQRAHARAGLLGNPSDGYHGKTLSFIVRNFYAEIVLYDWETLEILPSKEDRGQFASIHELVHDVALHGYYGGVRLIKATIKRFADFCAERTRAGEPGYVLGNQTFAIRYTTNIPRQVGLAGSSAIIVATLKALMDFYRVKVPKTVLPSLALSVERRELGIAAGCIFHCGRATMPATLRYVKRCRSSPNWLRTGGTRCLPRTFPRLPPSSIATLIFAAVSAIFSPLMCG